MAKLYFYYAAMNAGKSTTLLQAAFNYAERGMATMLFTAAVDDRAGGGRIGSRIGLGHDATPFDATTDLAACVRAAPRVACVLVDEAQFLTRAQVLQLAALCDDDDMPVVTYGLRTDFTGHLFEGSAALLGIADSLIELVRVCRQNRVRLLLCGLNHQPLDIAKRSGLLDLVPTADLAPDLASGLAAAVVVGQATGAGAGAGA